jgi:lysophospholipase L1-like esterase
VPAPGIEPIRVSDGGGSEYELSRDRTLLYVPRPNTGQFNAAGYRGPEIPVARTPGRQRVVVMGDSVSEGLGVKPHERFITLLSDRLGPDVEFVNLSVRGYNFRQEVAYLKARGLVYKPDHVLFCVAYNDVFLHSGEIAALDQRINRSRSSGIYSAYYGARNRVERWLLASHIYRHLYCLVVRPGSFYDSVKYRMPDEEVASSIREVKALGREHGFTVSFLCLPARQSSHAFVVMQPVLEAEAIPYLDLYVDSPVNWGERYAIRYFQKNDPCHLTEEGNQVVAAALHAHWSRLVRAVAAER